MHGPLAAYTAAPIPSRRPSGLFTRRPLRRFACVLAATCALQLAVMANGPSAAAADADARLRALEKNLEEQAKVIAEQFRMLQQQQRELQALKAARQRQPAKAKKPARFPPAPKPDAVRAADRSPAPTGGQATGQATQRQPAQAQAGTAAPKTAPADQKKQPATSASTEAEKPERPQIDISSLVERGGVLTPPGTLIVEPSIEYQQDASDRVVIEGLSVLPAILIGSVDVRRVERQTIIGALTGRLGLTNRFDIDVKVPYVYREDETTAREIGVESTAASVTSISGNDLGDIDFAGHYQLNDATGGWPYFIGNVRVKAPTGRDPFEVDVNAQGLQTELPTGTGFWAVEPSVSFLLPSPPVVWFGNIKYLWNVERDIGGSFGTIDPGDAVGATIGLGFSVNDKTSFSLGAEYQTVFETEQNGQNIDGTSLQIASGVLGLSYRASDDVLLNLSVQAGLTEDATDFRALFRVPVTFKVFNNLIPPSSPDGSSAM